MEYVNVINSPVTRALFTVVLALGLPLLAQTAGAQERPPTQSEVEGWFQEMQEVHTQLQGLQRQALEDPQLSAAQEDLGEDIKGAMVRIDPEMESKMARMDALESEAATAHGSGDNDRLNQLRMEAVQIQEHFMMVQQQALEEPLIAGKVSDFQTQLERRMVDLNPQAQGLIDRFRELENRLAALMGGGA